MRNLAQLHLEADAGLDPEPTSRREDKIGRSELRRRARVVRAGVRRCTATVRSGVATIGRGIGDGRKVERRTEGGLDRKISATSLEID